MPIFTVYISDEAAARYEIISRELARSTEDLISTVAEEAALKHFRDRADDPAENKERNENA